MSSREFGDTVRQGGGFVVAGPGLEASVQDADESVGQPSQRVVVFDSASAEVVVDGAGAGRGLQGGEGLRVQCVNEPVVVDETGGDDFLLPRRASDRAGGGVVPAGFAVTVAVRVVAEFAEHPGTRNCAHAGLGQVDLSVRVLAKMLPHLPFGTLTCSFRVVVTAISERTVAE